MNDVLFPFGLQSALYLCPYMYCIHYTPCCLPFEFGETQPHSTITEREGERTIGFKSENALLVHTFIQSHTRFLVYTAAIRILDRDPLIHTHND